MLTSAIEAIDIRPEKYLRRCRCFGFNILVWRCLLFFAAL